MFIQMTAKNCFQLISFITFLQDESDKRKQLIVLTDECRAFCEKNDDTSSFIMQKMFDGISDKDIKTTIKTIINIEKNLREFEED